MAIELQSLQINSLLEGSIDPILRCEERYGPNTLTGSLLALAGQGIENLPRSDIFMGLEEIPNRSEAIALIKESSVNRLNFMLANLPEKFIYLLDELTNIHGVDIQIGGSNSYLGLFPSEKFDELINKDQFDLDFNVSVGSRTEEMSPKELIKLIKDVTENRYEGIKVQIYSMDDQGNTYFTPKVNSKRQPYVVCFEDIDGTQFSFALNSKLSPDGTAIYVDANQAREPFEFNNEIYSGNFKVPDALTNSLKLQINSDGVRVVDYPNWNELFFDTLVIGKEGQLMQIMGMPEDMIQRVASDPDLRMYLHKCAVYGEGKYIWSHNLLELLQQPLASKDEQIVFDPLGNYFIVRDELPELSVDGQIDIHALLIAQEFCARLPGFPDNQKKGETIEYISKYIVSLLGRNPEILPDIFQPLVQAVSSGNYDLPEINEAFQQIMQHFNFRESMFEDSYEFNGLHKERIRKIIDNDWILGDGISDISVGQAGVLSIALVGALLVAGLTAFAVGNETDISLLKYAPPLVLALAIGAITYSQYRMLQEIPSDKYIATQYPVPKGHTGVAMDEKAYRLLAPKQNPKNSPLSS